MRVVVLMLAASAVALLPTGAVRGSARSRLQCPMPVQVPDSALAGRMPDSRANTAVPMPTQLSMCSNPLFVSRDSAWAGVLPNKRQEPTRP